MENITIIKRGSAHIVMPLGFCSPTLAAKQGSFDATGVAVAGRGVAVRERVLGDFPSFVSYPSIGAYRSHTLRAPI